MMYNAKQKLIYVGKAANLKSRVSSYFGQKQAAIKTQALVAQIVDIKVTITENETAALILEANLIKQYRPRYNVVFKDDKSYPYLMLNVQHTFPRLDIHRGTKKKSVSYFGPYPNASAVRENLNLLQKIFKLRQCSDIFFANRSRPCLQYQIKRCSAPCVKYVSEQEYAQQVKQCVLFMQGKNEQVMQQFTDEMQQASKHKHYEQAAQYRDRIARIRKLQTNQAMSQDRGDIDVIASVMAAGQAVICVLFIRAGRVLGHKTFYLMVPINYNEAELLEQFIPQYYFNSIHAEQKLDKIILCNKGVNKPLLQDALCCQLDQQVKLLDRKHPNYEDLQNMAESNAQFALQQRLSKKNIYTQQWQSLQQVLQLASISRIECFDISHTQGELAVASCVVFSAEGGHKSLYRRFNIKDIKPGDDYAAMYQAIKRRYTKLQQKGEPLPDLIMVDGGKGQLTQAALVVEELQLRGVMLLAVAKGPARKAGKEQLFLQGHSNPILLPEDSSALHLIQQIRDEAHRFAIQAHRRRRGVARITSKLEEITGIGPNKRQLILTHFGGMQGVSKASIIEIAKVKGISHILAEKIYKALH